ncbi:MAG: hypothetical protein KDB87_21235 [Flavobacteriales bacterium]|nr:hypothetical protein [Flavobacteriales bacterium]
MRIYRFRVLIDDPSEAFRDIEIGSDQTFLEFHQAIKEAFGFKGDEMACFYVSDEEWSKGPEVPLADMGFAEEGGIPPALMHDVYISDHMRSTDQRFVYAYDYLHMWMFLIELIGAFDPDERETYPRVVLAMGEAPDEKSRELDLTGDVNAIYTDDEDPYAEDNDEDLGHENIDDLGEEYQ